MVWVEEIYRGRKIEGVHLATKTSYMPKFMLIPKLEEEKYLKLAEEFADKDFRTPIPKYIKWPPLYKVI